MFWGLVVKNNNRYKQKVERSFHLSQATLDLTRIPKYEDTVTVKVEVGESTYILCHLFIKHGGAPGIVQVPLDVSFGVGEFVTFSLSAQSGNIAVHLTGYTFENMASNIKEESIRKDSDLTKPLVDLNKETKLWQNSAIFKGDQLGKENEAPSTKKKKNLEKLNQMKSQNKPKTNEVSQKNKNKKNKEKNKEASLIDILNSSLDEEEEEDDDYSPEDELEMEVLGEDEEEVEIEEDEENEDEAEEEDEDDDNNEEEDDNNEEEDGNNEEEDGDTKEDDWEDIDDDEEKKEEVELEEVKEEEPETLKSLKKKKKRLLSPSSAGRTPMVRSGKKQKLQDLNASPTLVEGSVKKRKNKSMVSDSSPEEASTNKSPPESNSSDEKSSVTKNKKKICMGGVVTEDLVVGTGATASIGKKASVYYEGKLKNGKVFDKSKSGAGFRFKLGANEVIKAWEVGILGMKVGGKRKIIAPPSMAYGRAGAAPDIPPNSILTFEVELRSIN